MAPRIREYLDHEGTRDCYQGPLRERIERLIAEMDAIRVILDTPPFLPHPEHADAGGAA